MGRRADDVISSLESGVRLGGRSISPKFAGAERNAHGLGGLFQGEAAKKAQLDQARLRLVERGKLDQGCVEIEQVGIPRRDGGGVRSQRYPQAAATLASTARARVIHEDTPHQ